MAGEEVHLDDVGTSFEVTLLDGDTVVDISSASVLQVLFKKPDLTLVIKTANTKTDGTDGVLQYVSASGDLDQIGSWQIQARVMFPNGDTWSSSKTKFKVYDNID